MYKIEKKIGKEWWEHGTYKSLDKAVKAAFYLGQQDYDDVRVEEIDDEPNEVPQNGQQQY